MTAAIRFVYTNPSRPSTIMVDGPWSADNPLDDTGTELSSPATPQVVSHIAVTIASVLGADYDEAERNNQPIEVHDGWVRAIAFLQAVGGGDIAGYESAEIIANEYLDNAQRWTSDSARAALGIGDRPPTEEIDWDSIDIDFSEFDLPDEGEAPKSQ